MYVIVTGSAGKLGRAAVAALRKAGHRVVGLDVQGSIAAAQSLRADCTDFGQVMGAFSGIDITGGVPDAVVHLAGIPMPGLATDQRSFEVNTISTYNVFSACARLGISRIVWASSETIFGLPFDEPPASVPLDESHSDRPNWSYALSKQLGETMAGNFCRWAPGLSIASLRFSNVYSLEDYEQLPAIQAKPAWRKMNLWAYVDAEDAGEACRLAVEAAFEGHQRLVIAADDSLMAVETSRLLDDHFPGIEATRAIKGHASLLSSDRAKAVLGYLPRFSWRDRVSAKA
ncbi:NAD-dependent epimerase/dehydratase family protein [Sphingopyxis granuli]|uniref:NAD-dependent epimerase/dehydratase family protein n=1 Tax=Sphingopyxis granuli TaxID=267128 RepID=UPI001BAF1FE8|nr:NAD(P)-dependent oxidoreductase [Sphingopyxis granuli]QUM70714.1 NAD(P)-dependent oxidoreductase [Sphingopyxis granuli]